MIIGSGLLATAFNAEYSQRSDVCIYAAGVSNSGCADVNEFLRERQRLATALKQAESIKTFVYFGTCSVADAEMQGSPYVQHKLAMEELVRTHSGFLILRLPQVVGKTFNPHTLLNFLYARISRSEGFQLWSKAKRNVIDVDDILLIARILINDHAIRNVMLNVANPLNYSMFDIVRSMEDVIGKSAVYKTVDCGSEYLIDIECIDEILKNNSHIGNDQYLTRVVHKYYGNGA